MLTFHELHDVSKVVAVYIQVFLRAGQRQAARSVRREVAQIPPFYELWKGRYPGVLFQCPKGGDPEFAFVLELDELGLYGFRAAGLVFVLTNQCFRIR